MAYPKKSELKAFISSALKEDIGVKDITTELLVPSHIRLSASLIAKEDCVICGLLVAKAVFKLQDRGIKFKLLCNDGLSVRKNTVIAKISGKAQPILTAERVALNFISLLSGIATRTNLYVKKINPYKIKIMDTRKTLPGLRELEKYAVRCGGGVNHRFTLNEMIMVKDNHIGVTGYGLCEAGLEGKIKKIKREYRGIKIEIEVKDLKEFNQALRLKPDIIMLDNMKISDMKKAVQLRNNLPPEAYHQKPKLEASGGINLSNVRHIAATGIDMISVGALTHSVKSVDISLEVS